jgi:hypothetical protein
MVPDDLGRSLVNAVWVAHRFEELEEEGRAEFGSQWRADHDPVTGVAHDGARRMDEEDVFLEHLDAAEQVMHQAATQPGLDEATASAMRAYRVDSHWDLQHLSYVLSTLEHKRTIPCPLLGLRACCRHLHVLSASPGFAE